MKNKKTLITVGVPAFNEERNIQSLLRDVLQQKQRGWELKEVLVYSDGSTDATVEKVKALKSPLIKINTDRDRKGQIGRIQEMFDNMKGDVLVMLDADLRLEHDNTISDMVAEFAKNNSVMLVGGNTMAFPPKNFFQRAVYSTFKVFYASRLHVRGGNNMFGCTGGCLAIRKKLARVIRFPKIKNQDAYMYFTCIKKGYTFVFVKSAVVYYKLPSNIGDYLSQVFRSNPEAVQLNLEKYFGKIVYSEFSRGNFFYIRQVIKVFLEDPLATICIIVINALCRPFFPFISKNNQTTWRVVSSTK